MNRQTPSTASTGASLVVAPLMNFRTGLTPVAVTKNVMIRPVTIREREAFLNLLGPLYMVDLGLVDARSCLASSVPATVPSPASAQHEFERIISGLRLLKRGNVGCNVFGTWHSGAKEASLVWSPSVPLSGPKYEITVEEIAEASVIIDQIDDIEADQRFRIALDRFSDTYHRRRANDKLIDYWVALEALFLDGGLEMSFKAALRIARYVGRSMSDRTAIFELMKKSYSARSKIVHGAALPANVAHLADKTEDVLRASFRALLAAGASPDLDALDNEAASAGSD